MRLMRLSLARSSRAETLLRSAILPSGDFDQELTLLMPHLRAVGLVLPHAL